MENVTLSEELGGACVSHYCRAIPTRVNGRGICECAVELVIMGVLALAKATLGRFLVNYVFYQVKTRQWCFSFLLSSF